MIYLSNQEAGTLLNKLRAYPAQAWIFDPESKVLSLRTASGANVAIEYRSWPGWEPEVWGQTFRQYRLSINGTDLGALDEEGKKREFWDVVDIKALFDQLLADEAIAQKMAERAQKKAQFKLELAAKEEQLKKDLVGSV